MTPRAKAIRQLAKSALVAGVCALFLLAVGAVFFVYVVKGHDEHIIATDAHAVNQRTFILFGGMLVGLLCFGGLIHHPNITTNCRNERPACKGSIQSRPRRKHRCILFRECSIP